jgi:hypothetical protein
MVNNQRDLASPPEEAMRRGGAPAAGISTALLLLLGATLARAADLSGQWYGAGWSASNAFNTTAIDLYLTESAGSGEAVVYIPDLGLFHESLPVVVIGDSIAIGDPQLFGMTGAIDGDTLYGDAWQSSGLLGTWYVARELALPPSPGPSPGPTCDDLPPLVCDDGGPLDCSALVPFEPVEGPGYLNYPIPGETWEDQRYSYLRRDLAYLIMYAAAKVACKTADWDYGSLAPIGLGDMSQADGQTPGVDVGQPRHPLGTHEDGKDIDTAYYQLYAPDNLLRAVGDHHIETEDQYHLVDVPYALDRWRTALFIASLAEHPRLRAVGVDGRIGLLLEETLDELVTLGWIDAALRSAIPLAYEIEDTGQGWFLFHHHHMHISLIPTITDVSESDDAVALARLHGCHPNPFNPRTTIPFTLSRSGPVDVSVYDAAGRLVSRLIEGERRPQGLNEVTWDGTGRSGEALASGVYFCRLEVGRQVETRRMTLLR